MWLLFCAHSARRAAICFRTLDLSPAYQPPEYVVPASWHGSSPFVEAKPSDAELRPDWWKLYDDPVLTKLIEQAMAANPDLEAAAERFVQARDMMMKARSQYLPRLGLGFGASDNRASNNSLFLPPRYSATGLDRVPWRARLLGARLLVGPAQCHAH